MEEYTDMLQVCQLQPRHATWPPDGIEVTIRAWRSNRRRPVWILYLPARGAGCWVVREAAASAYSPMPAHSRLAGRQRFADADAVGPLQRANRDACPRA